MKWAPLTAGAFLIAFCEMTQAGCLAIAAQPNLTMLQGRLSLEIFPGPPNYESVVDGDQPEQTWMLTLRENICADDGGDFADPTVFFDKVHLYSTRKSFQGKLKSLKGKLVRVTGSAFAAHTAHHHAPLVEEISSIQAD